MPGDGGRMLSYRWDSHGTNMMDNLSQLMDSQNNMANVSLLTEDGQVKVHRLVLSASSPYFRSGHFT